MGQKQSTQAVYPYNKNSILRRKVANMWVQRFYILDT